MDDSAPACLCDEGTRADGLFCVPLDGCATVSCAALPGSSCAVRDGSAACECPEGTFIHDGRCTPRAPCLPNLCTAPFQTTCSVVGGVATCLCDLGHAQSGSGCAPSPSWSCAAPVQAPGLDAAEPDGCPPRAPVVAAPSDVDRSLEPAGDEDWFELPTRSRGVLAFEAESLTQGLQLIVEIFDETGTAPLATSPVNGAVTRVTFASRDGKTAFARVRALNAGSTGSYRVRTSDRGLDDFADDPDRAESIELGAAFDGEVQFGGDVDRVWLEVPPGRGVGISSHGAQVKLEVSRVDAKLELRDGEVTLLGSEFSQQVLLSVSGATAGAVGAFHVELVDLGPDDHAGSSAFATVLRADGLSTPGTIERFDDTDVFALEQRAGRVYRARWQGITGGSIPRVTVLEPGGVVLATSGQGAVSASWVATADARVTLSVINTLVTTTGARYAIAVDELGPDDHGDSNDLATPAVLGVPVDGRVDLERDLDVFSVSPPPGRIFRAAVSSTVASTTLKVSIRQPSGAIVSGDTSAAVIVTQPGPHFVVVQAPSPAITPYTLVVSDDGLDDHPDVLAGASALTFGAWANGSTQFADDRDVFTFTPTPGSVYRLWYEHDGEPWPCTILDPSGSAVFGPVVPSESTFFAGQAGTWALRVQARSLGSFRVRLDEVGLDDHPPTPAAASVLTVGAPTPGRGDFLNDRDAFRFVASARRIYEVAVTGAPDVRLEQVGADGVVLTQGTLGRIRFSFGSEQPAFFVVVNATPDVTAYSVTVTALGLDDHGGMPADATPLALDGGATGVIDFANDLDLFAVPVGPPGRHLRARCEVTGSWCQVFITDAAGNELASTNTSGVAGSAWVRPPPGATQLFVSVIAEQQASYTVTFSDVGPDDVGDVAAGARALVLGAPAIGGFIEVPNDVDAFSVVLAAGDLVSVDCQPGTLTFCDYRVRTPAGLLLSPWPSGFRAGVAGTYLVEVSNPFAGTYSVAASLTADDHGNAAANATPISFGQQALGRLQYQGDVDVFSISMLAGQHITVESTEGCRVTARRANNQIATNTSEGFMEFDVTADGVHTLFVTQCELPYRVLVMR